MRSTHYLQKFPLKRVGKIRKKEQDLAAANFFGGEGIEW